MNGTQENVILNYQSVLDEIKAEDVKLFVMNCLNGASDNFKNDQKICEYVKKVSKVLIELMDDEGTTGMLKDMVIATILLSDITINDLPSDLKYLHPLTVKSFLDKFKGDMNSQMLEVLVTMIEGHEGTKSPSKEIRPKPGTPTYIIALAHQIARLKCVEII